MGSEVSSIVPCPLVCQSRQLNGQCGELQSTDLPLRDPEHWYSKWCWELQAALLSVLLQRFVHCWQAVLPLASSPHTTLHC